MCSEMPKEFQKTTEVLPFTKYGLSTVDEFRKVENDLQHLEYLKKIGLSNEEIKLYQENEAGLLDQRQKIESSILKAKLKALYNKINDSQHTAGCSKQSTADRASTSTSPEKEVTIRLQKHAPKFYAEGHPMNELKEIEEDLFGHLRNDSLLPITKRRKILRRLERKKEKIISKQKDPGIDPIAGPSHVRPGSLWDVKDVRDIPDKVRSQPGKNIIGPRKPTMYTIKEDKIVRLEPVERREGGDEFRAVEIVVPVNTAEEQLLEGTKMSLDDIKKIERFKDYEPGLPSKVLYLKNISPSVPREQLSLLFNQFHLENGGPVELRLMAGRMHGQAFVTFHSNISTITCYT
ncbi:RNA-binding protein 41 isoform X2 [Bicyclus anynana]|uniref:RNA-binding protein 41 isoform X2 n=1 Tax=Bicyclus anynana TaxID=110368 RepID=A0ABM3LZX2_BICAN|nr:RNA-binding protein 41 isoform X2 [Bicyclus anynana]